MSFGCCQGVLGLGQGGELGLPAGLQAAGDEPGLRLDRAEGAFGPVGLENMLDWSRVGAFLARNVYPRNVDEVFS
ncbi:hypothetical protein [Rhodococcus koreensis]